MLAHFLDVTRVHRRLYVGSRPTPGPWLRRAGFSVLVLCALPEEYEMVYGAGARGRDLRRRFDGLSAHECPLDDSLARPTPESVERACLVARDVASEIRRGGRVLCTCMAGRNRSAFVAALTMHDLTGASGPECARRIRALREPSADGPVLCNDWFNLLLASVQESVPRDRRRRRGIDEGDSDGGAP